MRLIHAILQAGRFRSIQNMAALFVFVPMLFCIQRAQAFDEKSAQHIADSDPDIQVLRHEVTLVKRSTGLGSLLPLGRLEAGKRYQVELLVHNPTEDDVPFHGAGSTCGCIRFPAGEWVLPAQGSAKLEFQIATPLRSKDSAIVASVRFADVTTNKIAFVLGLRYELFNMFKILGNQRTIEVPDNEEDFGVTTLIPMLIAAPLTLNDLEIVSSESLRDLAVDFVQTEGQDFIQVIASKKNLVSPSMAGELYVRRKGAAQESEDFDVLFLVVKLHSSISILPESIRLVKSTTDEYFFAKAILRIRTPNQASDETEAENAKISSETVPIVELRIDGKAAQVEIKKLGESGIYAVTMRYDGPLPEAPDRTLPAKWGIRAAEKELQVATVAYFQD